MAALATPTDAAIEARLDEVVEHSPVLSELRSLLGRGGRLTPSFLAAYTGSTVSGVARERLLTAALGDLSPRWSTPSLNSTIALRTLDFLEFHPTFPLSPWSNAFQREHIPQRLRRLYAPIDPASDSADSDLRPRLDAHAFVRLALLRPAVTAQCGTGTIEPPDSPFAQPAVQQRLLDLLPNFVLTPDDARRLLREPKARHAFTHYFHTGQPALDLRNALLYYAELLDFTDFESRAQHKTSSRIDRALLGLDRRGSHPLIALSTHLISLAVLGALEPGAGVWCHPVLGPSLAELTACRDAFGIEEIARRHFARWILDRSNIDRWHAVLQHDSPNARFTKVILFDLDHLLSARAVPGIQGGLADLYSHVDAPALLRLLLSHYRRQDDPFAEELDRCAAAYPRLFSGAHLRALANSLYYARHLSELGLDPRVDLPHAARTALGAVRPHAGASPRQPRIAHGQKASPRVREASATSLPLLDQLMPHLGGRPTRKRPARAPRVESSAARQPRPVAVAPQRRGRSPPLTQRPAITDPGLWSIADTLETIRADGRHPPTRSRKRPS